MSTEVFDIIIIGAGAAGLTAGIYSARSKRKTLILDRKRPGGQAGTTERLENYPGFPGGTGGKTLMNLFRDQSLEMGCVIEKGKVASISEFEGFYLVKTSKGKEFKCKSVILAPGSKPRQLGIKGEEEFSGRGVSYCATCDAELYEDAKVVVIGSGDSAVEEAVYLSRFAAEVVMVVVHDEGVLDCNKTMAEEALGNPKLSWRWNSAVVSIDGDELVTGVGLKKLRTGKIEHEECAGVFMFVGIVPQTDFLEGFVDLQRGLISHNEQMETNKPLIYTAGDASVTVLRQVVTAASDGAKAAFFADRALCEDEEYKKAIDKAGDEYFIYFYTPPVQISLDLFSEVEKIAEDAGLPLVKLDSSRFRDAVKQLGVESIPKLLSIKKGAVVENIDLNINIIQKEGK
jgi:thioredoxin reductase (NADPH)